MDKTFFFLRVTLTVTVSFALTLHLAFKMSTAVFVHEYGGQCKNMYQSATTLKLPIAVFNKDPFLFVEALPYALLSYWLFAMRLSSCEGTQSFSSVGVVGESLTVTRFVWH